MPPQQPALGLPPVQFWFSIGPKFGSIYCDRGICFPFPWGWVELRRNRAMSGGRRGVSSGPSCLLSTSEIRQHFLSELTVVLTHRGGFVHFCFTSELPGKALHVTWGLVVDGCLFNGYSKHLQRYRLVGYWEVKVRPCTASTKLSQQVWEQGWDLQKTQGQRKNLSLLPSTSHKEYVYA